MYFDPRMNQYLHQLQQIIHGQQQRIDQLEKQLTDFHKDLSGLKQEPRLAVDRIEYKFDQLKIERLDGTLNIGLTPKAGKELMDDLSVDGVPNQQDDNIDIPDHPNVGKHVLRDLDDYLKNDLLNDMKVIEGRLQMPLNESYRQFIIQDVRKQLDERVAEYLKQYNNKDILNNKEQIEQAIFDRVKRDILKGIDSFITKLKQGGEVT